MKKLCDLHTHSVFSDGTFTPTEIIDEAMHRGLSAVALCDHNTVDGLTEFFAAAKVKNIEAVGGAEFSVDYCGKELHLLGLFIDERYFSEITDKMNEVNLRKEQSNLELIESLGKAGIVLDYAKIKAGTPGGKVNRALIGRAMTEKGYTTSIDEAFATYLAPTSGHYKEPERLSVWETIDFINSIHAVPVLAHPFLNLKKDELAAFLPKAKDRGLVGMECYYSTFSDAKTALAIKFAREIGLEFSGGSDFHGENKPGIKLGVGYGNLEIPYEWYLHLKGRAGR